MSILVCGGAGYIGSHTCVELLNAGYDIVVADNLYNSCEEALVRVEKITGKKVPFVKTELCHEDEVEALFAQHPGIEAVIHFAGLKAVGESVSKPLEYYSNNLISTLYLLSAMRRHGVKNFVFSSSATVYGDPATVPIREDFPTGGTTNPYGTTKLFIERILMDCCKADPAMNVALLRYFNPIGAHPSALIGELPRGVPNNLLPFVTQTAAGLRECLSVFGNDYDTPDGTCLRDYIDVVDLAKAHVAAVDRMTEGKMETKYEIFNIGTGRPVSVLELLTRFEQANNLKLPYKIVGRRPGDVPAVWADTSVANKVLGWKAERDLDDTLRAAWAWEKHLRNIE